MFLFAGKDVDLFFLLVASLDRDEGKSGERSLSLSFSAWNGRHFYSSSASVTRETPDFLLPLVRNQVHPRFHRPLLRVRPSSTLCFFSLSALVKNLVESETFRERCFVGLDCSFHFYSIPLCFFVCYSSLDLGSRLIPLYLNSTRLYRTQYNRGWNLRRSINDVCRSRLFILFLFDSTQLFCLFFLLISTRVWSICTWTALGFIGIISMIF